LIESALQISFSLGWRTVMGDDAILQHQAVYEAVRDRQPEDAFLAMRRLLRNSKGNVLDAIWVKRREGH
jgi:DNA-binding FadR family transcriptional regulator